MRTKTLLSCPGREALDRADSARPPAVPFARLASCIRSGPARLLVCQDVRAHGADASRWPHFLPRGKDVTSVSTCRWVSYRISLVSLTPFWDREGDIFSPSHNCGYERGGLSVGEVSLQVGGTGVDGSRVDQGARPWPMGGYRSRRAGSSRTAATAELPRSQPHLATRTEPAVRHASLGLLGRCQRDAYEGDARAAGCSWPGRTKWDMKAVCGTCGLCCGGRALSCACSFEVGRPWAVGPGVMLRRAGCRWRRARGLPAAPGAAAHRAPSWPAAR
jgi:hypothetical protein